MPRRRDDARDARATSGDYPPELMDACALGAGAWDGVPVAAFTDPLDDELVVCWADGHTPKSPPTAAEWETPAPFDRVVFTAAMGGEVVEMMRAGYRDDMPVESP